MSACAWYAWYSMRPSGSSAELTIRSTLGTSARRRWRHARQPRPETHPALPIPPEVTRWHGATLTINSRNYGAWSFRGWLLCKMSGLDFDEHVLDNDDPDTRAELLLLSSSFLVPRLVHDGVDGVGHDGDRRVPERGAPRRRAPAVRHRSRGRTAARCAARCTRAS